MGHTPGPWSAKFEPGRFDMFVDNGGWRIDAPGVEQLAFVWVQNKRVLVDGPQEDGPLFGSEQAQADAALITAAPAMLQALRGHVQLLSACGYEASALEIEKIIAMAEGRVHDG